MPYVLCTLNNKCILSKAELLQKYQRLIDRKIDLLKHFRINLITAPSCMQVGQSQGSDRSFNISTINSHKT